MAQLKNNMQNITVRLILVAILFSCSCSKNEENLMDYNILQNLPPDLGGTQSAFVHNSTGSPYGFHLYTPSAYEEQGP